MDIIKNIVGMISLLSAADIILFVATITLIILIIFLIYVIRITDNKDLDVLPEVSVNELKKDVKDASLINNTNQNQSYEAEQEAKAIISYDELVNTRSIPVLNYQKEEEIAGLTVKKIDLNNLAGTTEPKPVAVNEVDAPVSNSKGKLISYAKEEEFLATLKRLQSL